MYMHRMFCTAMAVVAAAMIRAPEVQAQYEQNQQHHHQMPGHRAVTVQQLPPSQQVIYKPIGKSEASYLMGEKSILSSDSDYQQAKTDVVDAVVGAVAAGYGAEVDNKQHQHEDGKHHHHHHQPYGFGYDIEDGYGNKQWRHEKSSDPHQVVGSYGFKDKNGIMREVEYVADKYGFRAVIKTTEPGTASSDPAYVKLNANPVPVEYHHQDGHGHGQQEHGAEHQYQATTAAGKSKQMEMFRSEPGTAGLVETAQLYKAPTSGYESPNSNSIHQQQQQQNYIAAAYAKTIPQMVSIGSSSAGASSGTGAYDLNDLYGTLVANGKSGSHQQQYLDGGAEKQPPYKTLISGI